MRYILFNGKRNPKDLGAPEIEVFLSVFVTECNVSSGAQNLALSVILFFYKEVPVTNLLCLVNIIQAKKPLHLPTVLSVAETMRLFSFMDEVMRLLCDAGMRMMD